MRPPTTAARGYSLVEALVVVAIIGVISLVSVPNFMAMYRAMKIKSAVRLVSNDLRAARQEAVSRYRPMMISFGTTAAERDTYWIYEWNPATSQFEPLTPATRKPVRYLEPETSPDKRTVYFTSIGYPDVEPAGALDGRRDIIFEATGAIRQPPADPTLRVRTDSNVKKKEFILTVAPSGSLKVE